MTPETASPQANAQPQLLLVEDEDSLRTLLVRVLKRAGYRVRAARGGEEAVRAFADGSEDFLAALVDLTLPDMSGEALIDQLRAVRGDLPLIVCSGTARSANEFAAEGAPVRFLQKPFLPARLIEALAELLPGQSSSPSSAS
jgi:CheY-like chemotaxis protein